MKNKILYIFLSLIFSNFIYFNVNSSEQFNFDITEIEILNDGNIIKGLKKGTVKTNDGITITANTFIYDKPSNILTADGNVKIIDSRGTMVADKLLLDLKNQTLDITSLNNDKVSTNLFLK